VDFPQALKDLAERVGVTLPTKAHVKPSVTKDEKERLRECLQSAHRFFRDRLKAHKSAQDYLQKRGMTKELIDQFEIGVAPDSFSETYEHLLKEGFTRKEILAAGLGIQRELKEERIYDRFRNRIIFPIFDVHGALIAFGGRTLGDDDAKYINSSETPLYQKGNVFYGLHLAKETIRETKKTIVVEGYFDLIACHRVGVTNVVATSGTALTEAHAKLLKRYCETVVLCLDQDRAGKEAAERAFHLLSKEHLAVEAVAITAKDPDEAAQGSPEELRTLLTGKSLSYMEMVLSMMRIESSVGGTERRAQLRRFLDLLTSIPLASERDPYISEAAGIFQTTETALRDDLKQVESQSVERRSNPYLKTTPSTTSTDEHAGEGEFSKAEVALGLFVLYPRLSGLLTELISPEGAFASALYGSIKEGDYKLTTLAPEHKERVAILSLYCEQHGFTDWSESLAAREIRKNCKAANGVVLKHKQHEIKERLLRAHREGKKTEAAQLETQYQQLLKLTKMATT
jgi:DNA primase